MRFSTMFSFAVVAAALGLSACSSEQQTQPVDANTTPAAGVASASDASAVMAEPTAEAASQ